jgi:hypothetical protein
MYSLTTLIFAKLVEEVAEAAKQARRLAGANRA